MTRTGRGHVQWARACYGVDLHEDGARVVHAVRSRSGIRCTELKVGDLSGREDDAVCVGALSARESLMRWLEAPYGATDKAERVLPTLLDIQLPFALEDCVYAFLDVIRTAEGTTRALAVAARKSDVEKKLGMFGAEGVDPVVLDHEGVALWSRTLEERPVKSGSRMPRALIHLDGRRSTLVIGRGTELLGVHGVRPGDTGQIVRMLHAQLGAHNGGDGREIEWVWSGPGAMDGGAVSQMHQELQDEWPVRSYVHDAPEYFLARALATRALQPGPLRCNLRTDEFTHDRIAQRARGRAMLTAGVVLVSGILLCCVNPVVKLIGNSKLGSADRAFKTLAESLAPGQVREAKGQHALGIVRSELEKETAALQPFLAAFEPSLGELLVSAMKTGKKNDLRYEMLSLSREKIEVRGTSSDWNSFAGLLSLLGVGERHLNRRDAGADERIPFSIVADRKR